MQKIILGALMMFSVSTFATSPQQLSCNYNSSEGYKAINFKLADYTHDDVVQLEEEVNVGSKTISFSIMSRSGTMEIALLGARGVYTGDDICAGGGCPPVGSPKLSALLRSLTSWELGSPAMVQSYASPRQGVFYRIDCYLENI